MSIADIIYVTAKDRAEALAISRQLVEEGLIACANILPEMTAIYKWQGQLEEVAECAMILKARKGSFAAVASRIRALHSYETPAIILLAAKDMDADYLGWINSGVAI